MFLFVFLKKIYNAILTQSPLPRKASSWNPTYVNEETWDFKMKIQTLKSLLRLKKTHRYWYILSLECMFSRVRLFTTPWTIACQSLSVWCSRQEYWRGLPFPPPVYPLDPGIKPVPPASPALAVWFFPTVPPGKPHWALDNVKLNYVYTAPSWNKEMEAVTK